MAKMVSSVEVQKMVNAVFPEMPAAPVLELYGQRKRFTVPTGVKCLLEELSREVLREQPTDLYEFLANYLEVKLVQLCKKGKEHRHSWDDYRWSWEGTSLLNNEELLEFLDLHHLTWGQANHIAVTIQKTYRGWQGRKRFKAVRLSLQYEAAGEDGGTYTLVDHYYKKVHRIRKSMLDQMLSTYHLNLAEANMYALRIQKTYRSHRTRLSLQHDHPEMAEKLKQIEAKIRRLSGVRTSGEMEEVIAKSVSLKEAEQEPMPERPSQALVTDVPEAEPEEAAEQGEEKPPETTAETQVDFPEETEEPAEVAAEGAEEEAPPSETPKEEAPAEAEAVPANSPTPELAEEAEDSKEEEE